MRLALLILLIVHGLIHLLGFVRGFQLAEVAQLRGDVGRLAGTLWLLAGTGFVAAAVMLLLRAGPWWLVAGGALILSQGLIVGAWSDARVGTIANAIILIAVVLAWADARFQRAGDGAVRDLFSAAEIEPGAVVGADDLRALPAPVQRWLEASGVVGEPRVATVRLRQRGGLRTSPEQDFMPAEAEQYVTVDPPGLVWRVRTRMLRVLPIAGRDEYRQGRGSMQIRVASLIPVVDAAGPEIDQGALLRFLGEIVWLPSAALSPAIAWHPIDEHRARAVMSHGGITASAEFTFAPDGRFLEMSAERYKGGGAEATLERWVVPARAWRTIDGVTIPVEGDVVWKLEGGDFNYYRWEILEVDYDRPELYDRR
jgi:hypothetical protein